ncbi:hypothetical protein [Salinigranum halophilum]|uniref:hypothetical protein n=1 Tax=Salinigranum halophilum TaxID=2565931 RepID=UPI0010A9051F|nr:hypothetical protein [Salinigranum halophilum]
MRPQGSTSDTVDRLFAVLDDHRYVIYLGGLSAVVLSRALGPAWVRTPVFVVALTLMCTAYLAELDRRSTGVEAVTFVVAIAVVGIAVGAFVVAEVSPVGGFLFIAGGVLFFRAATRRSQHD